MAIRLRFRPLLAAALLCLGTTSTALAWAPLGHALVGELAQRHLDPKAQAEVARLVRDIRGALGEHDMVKARRLLERADQRMPVEDSYIAATARRHGLTIVTENDRDFKRPGLTVFNPFKELP